MCASWVTVGPSLKIFWFAVTRLTHSKCHLPSNIYACFVYILYLNSILDILSLFLMSFNKSVLLLTADRGGHFCERDMLAAESCADAVRLVVSMPWMKPKRH